MASGIYQRFKANLFNKEVDLEADTVKVMLLSSGHSFTATHNVIGDVSASEIAGTGYTAEGTTLAGKAVTQANTTKFDATDCAWTTATFTASHAVIYASNVSTGALICSIDFGGSKAVSAGTFTVQFDAAGIITLT